jgi:sulfite reductase alpha subunit-like flavoprotein
MLEDAVIYVCGDVAMAENVFQTFRSIIQREEDMEDDKGKNFMRYLKVSNYLCVTI